MKQKTARKRSAGAAKAPARKKTAPAPQEKTPGIRKQLLKSRPVCKVFFRLPAEAAPEAISVVLVGDFNGWNPAATPMKRLKEGAFSAALELEAGREYRFRYLIDGSRWENDWRADRYEPNSFGCDDSVVCC